MELPSAIIQSVQMNMGYWYFNETHELANKLLALENIPVVCHSNDYYSPTVNVEFLERRYMKYIESIELWSEDTDGIPVIHLY